jgi:hypothetical protein
VRRSLLSLLVVTALTGCMSTGIQVRPEQLVSFKEGETTEAEVVQKLGAPNTSVAMSDGSKITVYSFVQSQARVASFIPLIGPMVGGADAQMNSTTFRFDRTGKMISYQSTASTYGSGTGLAAGRPVPQTDQPRQAPQ